MLKIRSLQPADSEAVRHLFTQGHLNLAQDPELEEEVRRFIQYSLSDDLSDISRHYLGSSGNHFWVAEVEGQIKGTVGIQRRNDEEAELRRMSVAADSRHQGIGGELPISKGRLSANRRRAVWTDNSSALCQTPIRWPDWLSKEFCN